jgi:hypothetical protein
MNIINRLDYQLSFIKDILIKESESYTLNYNICETQYNFLDKQELQEYLTITDVKNTAFLKIINEKCAFIMDFSGSLIKSNPDKELKGNYNAFFITEERIIEYNSKSDKRDFVKKFDYTLYDLFDIIISCGSIIRLITAAHPKTIPNSLKSSNWLKQVETKKTEEVNKSKKTLTTFFHPEISINIIEKIQNDFKDFKGKKMAYLIYLLHQKFKIISYSINSKDESRKHFVSSLKGVDVSMSGINKHFESNDVKLRIHQFEKDNDYIDIEEKLTKTIK